MWKTNDIEILKTENIKNSIWIDDRSYMLCNHFFKTENAKGTYAHLYLLSRENPKSGDMCILYKNDNTCEVVIYSDKYHGSICKKITATNDIQCMSNLIPTSFIEFYTKQYNSKGVQLKTVNVKHNYDGPILNDDNTVIIKQNNIDLSELFVRFACDVYDNNYQNDMSFQQNAKSMIDDWLKNNYVK